MARRKQEDINRDKELAKSYFIHQGWTRKAIAKTLNYTEKTIGAWVIDGAWEKDKKTLSYSKGAELQRLMGHLEQLNDSIEKKDEGSRYPDSKEADIQKKITASIRDLETEMNIKDAVNVCIELMQSINRVDATLAKTLSEHVDKFLRGLRS